MTRFTDDLARQTAPIRDAIHAMPFNLELADGTLRSEIFRGYIIQDAHYLEGFARALSLAASKAHRADAIAQLAGSAGGAITAERTLHAHYMQVFGVTPTDFHTTATSAACDHYVSFLLRTAAIGEFAEAVAALLPCFWIYRDVGRTIAQTADASNPYAAWIATYSSDAFDQSVEKMLALTDELAADGDDACKMRMHQAFARSCWHEWHFWDSAYHARGWADPLSAP